MNRARFAIVALASSLVLAGEVSAQPDVEIQITDRGTPLSGIQISQLLNGIKTRAGVTDATGQASFLVDALDFGKGDRVSVWVRRCEDGEVEVILVAEGEDDPCAGEDAAEGEGCGCERIGAFLWGDDVVIDIGNRTVTPRTTGGTPPGGRFTVGGGIDLRHMSNLEDVVGMTPGVIDHDATTWAPGFQFFTEYLFLGFVALGIEAAWSRMETEARFQQGTQTGELDYWEVGGTARIGLPGDRPIWPYLLFGLYRTWNQADFQLDGVSDQRTHVTRRDGLGAGLDWMFRPAWGVRAEGMYSTTFEDDDADEHIRLKLGLIFRPFLPQTF